MKHTICGKGGSGKSTITALPKTFVDYFGGKAAVMEKLAGSPQNMPMLFDQPWKLEDIPADYVSEKDGVLLMSPGKNETANEACACPFNAIMVQFVPMLQLADDEVVLMDMEAGIEHFGRGTDNATDVILMIVDPSYESIKLSKKVAEIENQLGKPIYYVLNKATDAMVDTMKAGVDDPSKICGFFSWMTKSWARA